MIFRSWSGSSLQGSPGIQNAEPRHRRTISCVLPLVDLIAPGLTPSLDSASRRLHLTSLAHLTHLDTSAVLMSDADPAFDDLLRALSAAPKLKYVGVYFLQPSVQWSDGFPLCEIDKASSWVGKKRGMCARHDTMCGTCLSAHGDWPVKQSRN